MNGWVPLYGPQLVVSPKFSQLTMDERGAWVTTMAYAVTTGGLFDPGQLRILLGKEGITREQADLFIGRLVEVRLLDPTPEGGHEVHDWDEWQRPQKPSDSPEATRERKRQQRARDRSGVDVTPVTRDVTPVTRDQRDGHAVTPKKREDETRSEDARGEGAGEEMTLHPPGGPADAGRLLNNVLPITDEEILEVGVPEYRTLKELYQAYEDRHEISILEFNAQKQRLQSGRVN